MKQDLLLILLPLLLITSSKTSEAKIIIGGSDAARDEWPWFASGIEISGQRGCGGMLVAPEYVLSAAHCFQSQWASFQIGALCTDQNNNCNQIMEDIAVESYTLHPDWNPQGGDGDYALVRLSEPSTITPVQMDDGSVSNNYSGGEKVWVSGFGTTSTDPSSPTFPTRLQEVEISIVNENICQQSRPITENMICAADPGKNSCNGDSGGPLYDKSNGVLIGVVSSGPQPCAPQNGPPGIYANVASQYDWITSTICNAHDDPKPSFCESAPTSTPPPIPAPTTPPPTPMTTATCSTVGFYFNLKNKFCKDRANKSSAKYARFWEVQPGNKQDVLNIVCKTNPCKKRDCCKWGPGRNCSNTGKNGLVDGGFTKSMCGANWKKKSNLKQIACTGKRGEKCLRKNCCKKIKTTIFQPTQ